MSACYHKGAKQMAVIAEAVCASPGTNGNERNPATINTNIFISGKTPIQLIHTYKNLIKGKHVKQ